MVSDALNREKEEMATLPTFFHFEFKLGKNLERQSGFEPMID